jgi:hypothetical protein
VENVFERTPVAPQRISLEKRGYLDRDRRGERADECDAIEMIDVATVI